SSREPTVAEIFETMEYGPAPESDSIALEWLERHGRLFGHFVGGRWLAPSDGTYFDTLDPARGTKLAAVASGSSADVEAAVAAAEQAQPAWEALGGHARARYLYAIARQVQKHHRLFA